MAQATVDKKTQPEGSFQHTCFLFSPLQKNRRNPPYLAFLSEADGLIGGELGNVTPGRQVRKQLLTTKGISTIDLQMVLEGAWEDVSSGRVSNLSVNQYTTQRLMDWNLQKRARH